MVKIKLGDVIDFKNGKSIKKSDGVIPIYGGNGILGYTDKSNFSHTIVVGRVGAYCGSIYVEENSCWVSDNAIAGVPKEGQDLTYLYYVLKSLNLNSKQIGSSQPLITQSMLRDMVVDIEINIEEQKRIANSISIIDQKIQINNQINQELEAMAKTLYDYWFVQFDFPDQNGKPYKSSGGKMVYHPELKREIPEGWGVEKLENLGTIVGGSTPTKSISDNFTKGGEGYSWITPNDLSNNKGNKFIKNGEIDVTVRGLKDAGLKLYPEGTVLMSSRAPVGYLAISTKEITTNQGFKSFIPDKKYGKNYIYYTLQNNLKVIEQHASGSTFKEISATVLKDITIIQPNLDIVKKFEEKVSSINSYIKVNEEQKQELTQVRDWLLPMLMNGQVKVE
ncbi:restriction endonuclease subunit S [Streptococcus thermophilus]|uniref:restriction endonuclease subunit S n=1 Tax=Streptococcus thermophilus TaxID=1308 RepID=UPI000230DD92|nr:restriction endonuclease subunit S [Streptococcus thermophilus]EHE87758.1 Type I site-specific deoxyribonuclease [Streptococcus thermophilus CNCM I-1630]CDA39749.1 type I site-specific deoxyribonuclease [Streptococcus thermophilus CAG:236]MCT1187246.1 restriction endonuclease subunit S [Streptococcus thermophilus]MCT2905730.1 restriction endonuclease subunit S [Streptococcus thermophilus]MCT2913953.1 restriction endonuclease subunit S [Streptococcus thermophilus]